MTETKEQELKPCPFCGSEPYLHSPFLAAPTMNGKKRESRWQINCPECCVKTSHYATKEEARAAWNRRAVPDMQWSSEPPTEPGYYWKQHGDNHPIVLEIFGSQDGQLWIASTLHNDHILLSTHLDNVRRFGYTAYWCKMPPPPMPERREK